MKKFLYILSILAVVTLFNSCTKEGVYPCGDHDDPFTQENFDDSQTRGNINGPDGGGVIDPDGDDDVDDDTDTDVVDPDSDDDTGNAGDEELDDRLGDADED